MDVTLMALISTAEYELLIVVIGIPFLRFVDSYASLMPIKFIDIEEDISDLDWHCFCLGLCMRLRIFAIGMFF
jgi:hypothetical protein